MGHYLLDLGADASRGSRLREGWEVESDEQDASYLKLSLKHPSGFANKMVVSWTADRVDVACEMTVPETVATYPSFRPGGGWEASRDKWGFPTSSGVQTGSFSYPGGTTRAIYPADGSFQIPSEGWIALWDDKVDEVYGFTFSNGYAAAIWNGVTAEPVGQRKSAGLQGAETMAPAMPRLKPSRDARRGAKDPGCRDRLGGILRYYYRKAARPSSASHDGSFVTPLQEVRQKTVCSPRYQSEKRKTRTVSAGNRYPDPSRLTEISAHPRL